MGMMLPIMHMGMAVLMGISKRLAAKRPPLSSSIGNMLMIKTTASAETYCPKVSVNNCTNDSIKTPKRFFASLRMTVGPVHSG